jgi:hypothetical protein
MKDNQHMNTASKLGPRTQTDRGTYPGMELQVYYKRRHTTRGGGFSRYRAQLFCLWALAQLLSCYPRPRLIQKVLDCSSQAIVRGGARRASQVLDRGAQANALGAPRMYLIVVYKPLPEAPLVVRCMCMVVVPRPMPEAVASRCSRCRFQQLACACDSSCQD